MFSFLRRTPRVIPMPTIDEAIAKLVASTSILIEANRQGLQVSRDNYYADYRLCYLAYDNSPFSMPLVYTLQAEHLINRLTYLLTNSDVPLEEHLRLHFKSFAENIVIELMDNTPNTGRAQSEATIVSTSTEELSFNRML